MSTHTNDTRIPHFIDGTRVPGQSGRTADVLNPSTGEVRSQVALASSAEVDVAVPIPVPVAYHTFGGWKRSGFGDLNQHGPSSIIFYTKVKTVTQRWPSGIKDGADFSIPTMN